MSVSDRIASRVDAADAADAAADRAGGRRSLVRTVRRGLQISPELVHGLGLTLALAVVWAVGRLAVPVTVQQALDRGIAGPGGTDPALVAGLASLAVLGVAAAFAAGYAVDLRLFRASEAGLATLRTAAFRHIHDLSVLTQASERRGALVSRVTGDVDTVSTFVAFGGIALLVSLTQVVVATVVMLVYSPLLTAAVWLALLPLLVALRPLQGVLARGYAAVRQRIGGVLASLSEAVVGAETVRVTGTRDRTAARLAAAVAAHRRSALRASSLSVGIFATGTLLSGLALSAVVLAGLLSGPVGGASVGELLAFVFIVPLFTQPVQILTEALNEAQNAAAGWRRVIEVLDTGLDVADPGDRPAPQGAARGPRLPDGPLAVAVEDVDYRYPGGPPVLRGVRAAVAPGCAAALVGTTGSGKTTLAKLLVRFDDPEAGRVLVGGVDVREVPFVELRRRVAFVPQEGFLFDTTVGDNIAVARAGAGRAEVEAVLADLGLDAWVRSLPAGLDTPAGQRGEALSAGERQLVAVARAHLTDPDLLVLDEATSAVDPVTEQRLQRALRGLTRGRTTVSIAHRLSTAEGSDTVLVMSGGRVVEQGPHAELVAAGGDYARLHRSWRAQVGEGP